MENLGSFVPCVSENKQAHKSGLPHNPFLLTLIYFRSSDEPLYELKIELRCLAYGGHQPTALLHLGSHSQPPVISFSLTTSNSPLK